MTLLNGITPTIIDRFWDGIGPDHPDVVYALSERFEALLLMPAGDRDRAIALLLDLESGLPERELAGFLAAELRALTALPAQGASDVLVSLDRMTGCQAGSSAMRRTVALQAASRELTLDEISHLELALPAVRQMAGLPPARPAETVDGAAAPVAPASEKPRRWSLARLISRD